MSEHNPMEGRTAVAEPQKPDLPKQGGNPTKPDAQNRRSHDTVRKDAIKILIFSAVLLVGCLTGLLWFLRPSVSEAEKRELTKFPELTWDSFISGEFFSDVTLWYADTFPGRDAFISLNQKIKNLYGIRQMQIVQNPSTPVQNPGTVPETPGGDDEPVDNTPVEKFDSVFIKGDRAFEIYHFSTANSDRYASIINSAAEKITGAEIYNMIVPLSYSVNLSASEQKQIGASDVQEAIAYMYGKMNDRVHTVEVLSGLTEHKNEELYYRTDHHWTARGAYYGYVAFCNATGQTALPLDSWRKLEFSGFLGTLYQSAGQPSQLANHPDTVEAWVPNSTNSMQVLYREKSSAPYAMTSQFPIVQTSPNYYQSAGSKYNTFLAGDHPLIVIQNPNPAATNGKKIVVVKESYGNAFVPFLVDQYAEVHVVDYRYFKSATGKTLPQYVSEIGADQVLFINYVYATGTSARLNDLENLIG